MKTTEGPVRHDKPQVEQETELKLEKEAEEDGVVNVNAPRWRGLRKRHVNEGDSLTEPSKKSMGKKKHKLGTNYSSKGTRNTTRIVEPWLLLKKDIRSYIDFFRDPLPETVPEELREQH